MPGIEFQSLSQFKVKIILKITDFGFLISIFHIFSYFSEIGTTSILGFRILVNHPVLQSTPLDAHRKMSITPLIFTQFYGRRAKLGPKTDFYMPFDGIPGGGIFLFISATYIYIYIYIYSYALEIHL